MRGICGFAAAVAVIAAIVFLTSPGDHGNGALRSDALVGVGAAAVALLGFACLRFAARGEAAASAPASQEPAAVRTLPEPAVELDGIVG
ncbi:hypothetical protein LLS1_14710 [Leifsonia sp. LS1]|nr:hypothetical protein LLS1_14710 [Leifsonia sp. LS1]